MTAMDDAQDEAYLVIMDRGGLFGVYLDPMRALEAAQNIMGIVCTVPITADFRVKQAQGEHA